MLPGPGEVPQRTSWRQRRWGQRGLTLDRPGGGGSQGSDHSESSEDKDMRAKVTFSIICGSILKTGHSHEMLLEDPAWPRDIDGYPPKWPDKSCLGIVINYINDISIWISIFSPGLCRCLLLLEWQLPRCFASPRLGNQFVPKRRFGHTPNAVVPYAFNNCPII